MTRKNYIYVDYENVREVDLNRISGKAVHVTLVLGQQNRSLPVPLVKLIKQYAAQVELIQTELVAKDALDFVLAYEVGRQTQIDPKGYYHILSGDKGFEAVIIHLKSRNIFAARHESFTEIPFLMDCKERVDFQAPRYQNEIISRPGTREKLESSIQTAFGRGLTVEEVNETIKGLEKEKVIQFDGDEVKYLAVKAAPDKPL